MTGLRREFGRNRADESQDIFNDQNAVHVVFGSQTSQEVLTNLTQRKLQQIRCGENFSRREKFTQLFVEKIKK